MKKIVVLLFVCWSSLGQVKFLSWNIQNFGDSKIDPEIEFIAQTVKEYDLIALQEIVAGPGGAKAIARLNEALKLTGNNWEYVISDPTTSKKRGSERYAFLWKSATVKKIGNAWLEHHFNEEIDREPYLCSFQFQQKIVTIVNFHAIPKAKQPETEIKFLQQLLTLYPTQNLIFAGDFNCPQSHSVFIPLQKQNYKPVFKKQKTSLRKACKNNDCLASEYDNIWYQSKNVKLLKVEALHFYKYFKNFKSARRISDHIPISAQFELLN